MSYSKLGYRYNLLDDNPIGLWVASAENVRLYSDLNVDRWWDVAKSGDANRHAAQNTLAEMAQFVASNSDFGGRSTVRFSNLQRLISGTWSAAIVPPFALVACLKFTGSATGVNRVWMGDATNGLKCVNYIATDNKLKTYNDSPAAIISGSTMSTVPQVISTKWVTGSSTCTLRQSVSMATIATGSIAAGLSIPGVIIGNQFGYNSGIVGDIHSIGIFPGDISDAAERRIMQGMAEECNIVLAE